MKITSFHDEINGFCTYNFIDKMTVSQLYQEIINILNKGIVVNHCYTIKALNRNLNNK